MKERLREMPVDRTKRLFFRYLKTGVAMALLSMLLIAYSLIYRESGLVISMLAMMSMAVTALLWMHSSLSMRIRAIEEREGI